jgi:hypothetical protein
VDMSEEQDERSPETYGIVFAIFVLILLARALSLTWFSDTVIKAFGSFENNFVGIVWRVISLDLLLAAFPMAIAVEAMWDHWKKRRFQLRRALIPVLLIIEAITAICLTGLAFEVSFPGYFTNKAFTWLTGLALGLLVAVPMMTLTLTIRTSRIRKYFKKAYLD